MGKRSEFARRPQDHYDTIDPRAVKALAPFINGATHSFAEPCDGNGCLREQLEDSIGLKCVWASDIATGFDALNLTPKEVGEADLIITNPPWSRDVLHKMIEHFQMLRPTWLLFDSDWAYNRHAAPYLEYCTDIVAVGRLRWIPNTRDVGKDNVSWYKFWHRKTGPTRFHGRAKAL